MPIGSIFTLNTVKQHQYLAKNFLLTTIELCTYGIEIFEDLNTIPVMKFLTISIELLIFSNYLNYVLHVNYTGNYLTDALYRKNLFM